MRFMPLIDPSVDAIIDVVTVVVVVIVTVFVVVINIVFVVVVVVTQISQNPTFDLPTFPSLQPRFFPVSASVRPSVRMTVSQYSGL